MIKNDDTEGACGQGARAGSRASSGVCVGCVSPVGVEGAVGVRSCAGADDNGDSEESSHHSPAVPPRGEVQ